MSRVTLVRSVGLLVLLAPTAAWSQTAPYFWSGGEGDFGVTANWLSFDANEQLVTAPGAPESRFNEVAVFEDGGVATVNGVISSSFDGTEVRPGGLELINGTVTLGAAGQLRVVSDPVNNPENFTVGDTLIVNSGVLEITSGAVFETETLQMTDADPTAFPAFEPGRLNVTLTGAEFTPVRVETDAVVGGILGVGFAGYTPSTTDAWTVASAGTLNGQFDEIRVSGFELPAAQFYDLREVSAPGSRTELELFRNQTQILLEVNLDNGEMTLSKLVGEPIMIDGYRVVSEEGRLLSDDASWDRLGEQFPNGSWRASNSSATQIAELEPNSATAIGDMPISLGRVFVPEPPTAFREEAQAGDQVQFLYTTQSGALEQGVVSFVGSPNDLVLSVNTVTGQVELSNPTPFDVPIDAYQISSTSGSLEAGAWESLDSRDGFGGWRESNPSDEFLAELLQEGDLTLSGGDRFDLGSAFDITGSRDLVFEFLMAGETAPLIGTVQYVQSTPELAGDFNADGVVDAADYTVWRDNLGLDATALNGNGSGDPSGSVVAADYQLWRSNFGATGGVSTSLVATPEPTTVVLAALVMLHVSSLRPHRVA